MRVLFRTLAVLLLVPACAGGATADPVALAKLGADGAPAVLAGVCVTASFDGFFYVRSPGSFSGLRVHAAGHTVAAGDVVNLSGVMGTTPEGERVLLAQPPVAGGASVVRPVFIRTRDAGGSDWLFDPVTGAGQRGVPDASGLNNVGLLVTVAGRVGPSGDGWFTVDDGSGGLRISAGDVPPLPQGAPVRVTGVVSLGREDGNGFAMLLPRSASDVSLVGGAVSGRVLAPVRQIVPVSIGSPHPCPDRFTGTWPVQAPHEAVRFRLHFTRVELDVLDLLEILGPAGELRQEISWLFYNFPLNDFWSSWIPGNAATLRLETDELYFLPSRYGFQCDLLEAEMPGAGVGGVVLTLSPGGQSVVTGPDGRFLLTGLGEGLYRLTPVLPGASFQPPFTDVYVADGELLHGLEFWRQ